MNTCCKEAKDAKNDRAAERNGGNGRVRPAHRQFWNNPAQPGFLARSLVGPVFGRWIVKGDMASSLTLNFLPLTDPRVLLPSLVASAIGGTIAWEALSPVTMSCRALVFGAGPVILSGACTRCGHCIDVCSKKVFEFGTHFGNKPEAAK